jgi:hypothetical protein
LNNFPRRTHKVELDANPAILVLAQLLCHAIEQKDLGPRFREGADFSCAPWKRLRIFEGIVGIFQDAHFRKPCAPSKQVRTFGRVLALHPVPLTYGCAQPLAPASFAVFGQSPFRSWVHCRLHDWLM